MADHDIQALLTAIPALAGMDGDTLQRLIGLLEVIELADGDVLIRQGDHGDAMFYLASGQLDVRVDISGNDTSVATIDPGAPVGETQLLTGGIRTATVVAKGPAVLLRLGVDALRALEASNDVLYRTLLDIIRDRQHQNQLAAAMRKLLPDLDATVLAEVSHSARWIHLPRGRVLFNEGDPGTSWYILLDGRLDVRVGKPDGQQVTVNQIERGTSFGEAALFGGNIRTATIAAARDCELVEIDQDAFDRLRLAHPDFLLAVSSTLVAHLTRRDRPAVVDPLKVLLVQPGTGSAPLSAFCGQLAASLSTWGGAAHLSPEILESAMDIPAAAFADAGHPAWHRVKLIADGLGDTNRFLVLECGADQPVWRDFCDGRADEFVDLVATVDPVPGRGLDRDGRKRTLVLQQPPGTSMPSGTLAWLDRFGPDWHLHLRDGSSAQVDRVARRLAGQSVGLVLGGGGARGMAHIGAWQALMDAGIPVDAIGGTSIGSVISGNIAMGRDVQQVIDSQRQAIALKPFKKYTTPMMSIVKGSAIDEIAKLAFADVQIEDLWIPYFCVSADLTAAQPVVHRQGPLWKASRASGSLPVVAMPVLEQGHLLVDGGVFNNLPGDLMRDSGVGYVVAVNVSPETELEVDRDELPTNWDLFLDRWLPGREKQDIPGLADILIRTMVLSSAQRLDTIRQQVDLLLEIPVDPYGMLQFDAIDELIALGQRHTAERLAAGDGADLPRTV